MTIRQLSAFPDETKPQTQISAEISSTCLSTSLPVCLRHCLCLFLSMSSPLFVAVVSKCES